jgi:hypothetical protein
MDSNKSRIQSEQVKKGMQTIPKPVTIVTSPPSGRDIANLNQGGQIFDEGAGILYIKGKNKTLKITGTLI